MFSKISLTSALVDELEFVYQIVISVLKSDDRLTYESTLSYFYKPRSIDYESLTKSLELWIFFEWIKLCVYVMVDSDNLF